MAGEISYEALHATTPTDTLGTQIVHPGDATDLEHALAATPSAREHPRHNA